MGKNVLRLVEKIKGKDVTFLLLVTLFTAIADVLFYIIHDGDFVKSFLILGANYMMALGMWLLLRMAGLGHIGKIVRVLFGLIISFYFSTLVFCWYCFGNPMDKVMIALVAGTNNEETNEFLQTYITPSLLTVYCLTIIVVFGLFVWLTSRHY